MKRSKFTDEQILAIVKEGDVGRKVADLCRANGITEQTYYRWKAMYIASTSARSDSSAVAAASWTSARTHHKDGLP